MSRPKTKPGMYETALDALHEVYKNWANYPDEPANDREVECKEILTHMCLGLQKRWGGDVDHAWIQRLLEAERPIGFEPHWEHMDWIKDLSRPYEPSLRETLVQDCLKRQGIAPTPCSSARFPNEVHPSRLEPSEPSRCDSVTTRGSRKPHGHTGETSAWVLPDFMR